MVPIGGGSTKFVLSDRWIVYTKSRKQLLHRKYPLYETGCIITSSICLLYTANTGDFMKKVHTATCVLRDR